MRHERMTRAVEPLERRDRVLALPLLGQEIRVDGGMSAGLGLPLFGAIAGE